jgi:hypothetical protein
MSQAPQEAVMLFDAEGDICDEMLFSEFEQFLGHERALEGYAASVLKAVYCVVGDGLNLRGAVFFQFSVDEHGTVDPAFNLPLRYLAQNAGVAEDLGQGPVRKASRAQCPVPWHAVNLWEPLPEKGIAQVQSRIYRNKLKLKLTHGCKDEDFFACQESVELYDNVLTCDNKQDPAAKMHKAHTMDTNDTVAQNQAFAAKLTEVFGEAGKLSLQDLIRLHAEQLDQAKAKHRQDLEDQQLSYLDQLRTCREEIHELKVALRQEQGRNRRLQQMLRGDI